MSLGANYTGSWILVLESRTDSLPSRVIVIRLPGFSGFGVQGPGMRREVCWDGSHWVSGLALYVIIWQCTPKALLLNVKANLIDPLKNPIVLEAIK